MPLKAPPFPHPHPERGPAAPDAAAAVRPTVRGKFFYVGDEKLYVRGVTYGTFRPREDGSEFPEPEVVERDFALMAANGINAVRTYTVPPRWLLDAAQRRGLRVLAGFPVERYIGYLADRKKDAPDVAALVRAGVRDCAGHPAILAYCIGNEIPGAIVRWHGARRVERYLERLCRVVRDTDPAGLVTYASYPSTEYLALSFLDFVCFNVFLEHPDRLAAYLGRLQCLAGNRPLVMGEIGLDAHRNGEATQACSVDWQIQTVFAEGCAGLFVYSWTDEWHRGGAEVFDWAFGLTRRDRRPKPALASARRAFAAAPFGDRATWPRISVVVCTYNGSRTLDECLTGIEQSDYPDYEVIVVNDGSTDATAEIAARHQCRLIITENRGLSSARNTGWAAATGSIVAYIDDDAYPDPHWLRYLALSFDGTAFAGVGGANLPPPGDGWIAQCVANAPGNPVHVLVSDREAEHIPGCNMAFRRSALEAIGGFDPRFRVAGDDVDLCWRLTDAGLPLGFSHAAVVWHHRRGSIRAFMRQQRGYGRAEAMLERRWPHRHDEDGHIAWSGRIYGPGLAGALGWRAGRVYHGIWGTAPFQFLYEPAGSVWQALARSPILYLVAAMLGTITLLGIEWKPLAFAGVPLVATLGLLLVHAGRNAAHAVFPTPPPSRGAALKRWGVTAFLYLAQPLARLAARLAYDVRHPSPRPEARVRHMRPIHVAHWSEQWQEPAARLATIESALCEQGGLVRRGGAFDRWDLEIRWGVFGSGRLLAAIEEHGGGSQLVRIRLWSHCARRGPLLTLAFAGLGVWAMHDRAWVAATALALAGAFFAWRTLADLTRSMSAARKALARVGLAQP